MALTYGGIPRQLSAPIVDAIAGTTTEAISGNLFLQARNRQGVNLISAPTAIALSAGQGARVTIPDCLTATGWDILYFYILFSPDSYVDAVVLARYSGAASLPGTVELTADEHFEIGDGLYLAAEADLPGNPVEGMRRYVDGSWAEIREWNGLGWEATTPQGFVTIAGSTTGTNGCDRPLPFPDPSPILKVEYAADGGESGEAVFWIRNDSAQAIPSGRGIQIRIYANGSDLTDVFFGAGAIAAVFHGFVNTATGEVDLSAATVGTMGYVGEDFIYESNDAGLFLEKDLPPGWAYSVGIKVAFTPSDLNGRIGSGTRIDVEVAIGDRAGVYLAMADLFGDLIDSSEARRVIVPARGLYATALPGRGIVNGFVFRAGERTIYGLDADTDNQKIAINGNGACVAVDNLSATQALRGWVGTVNGVGTPVLLGSVDLDSNTRPTIALTHATAIRADADSAIAGNTDGDLNATGAIAYFVGPESLYFPLSVDLDLAEQTWEISASGTAGGVPSSSLGLYLPDDAMISTVAGSSAFAAAGSYQVYLAYTYENAVTRISLQGDGIIRIFSGATILEEMEAIARRNALVLG